jgi:predicted HTH transcriptional regulator
MVFRHPVHESLLSEGWAEVQSLRDRGEQETVELDFKTKSDPTTGALEKKEREILAQAMAALANSMGGAIIYGIDCRTNSDGVDEACGLKPIQSIKRFASEVRTNIPNLVIPR